MVEERTSFRFSQRATRATEQPIGYLMTMAVDHPELISLAAGLVDNATLPGDESRAILTKMLSDERAAQAALQYGTTEGHAQLRRVLLEHMAGLDGLTPEDFDASPDDVVVTTGSQQLLFLITDVLVDPGDIVITEWPSYFVYTGALKAMGAEVRCVDIDEHGMIPEKLDALLAELAHAGDLHRVKIVYTVDYHQNPSGITLRADRRPRLLEIVQRYSAEHRILLLEDAAYRELTYEGTAPPAIKTYDTDNKSVALLQTFSKPFSPGLKTGYGLLPRDLAERVLIQKGSHDFGSANICQHLLLRAMTEGVYAQHVKLLCKAYAAKRDAMLAALDEHLGDVDGVTWTRPSGGLYVWLTLPEGVDTGRGASLIDKAIAEGVLYVPGVYSYPDDATRTKPTNQMRLSFGLPGEAQIVEGIARLARAIRE
ncbi:MAG: aminotransferase class I/II-fold pyridoxal phosphate-dependent enzyme [Phycisphaera sp.]|nr:aminotransferase class I/II-fold pyridoxal phosphate-dependent enzyme [Phycisphaera sp.]